MKGQLIRGFTYGFGPRLLGFTVIYIPGEKDLYIFQKGVLRVSRTFMINEELFREDIEVPDEMVIAAEAAMRAMEELNEHWDLFDELKATNDNEGEEADES